MNELTTRLHTALSDPTIKDIRRSGSAYASAASLKVPNGFGGEETVGACLRQQFYRIKGEEPTDIGEIDWSISSYMGDAIHEMIVDILHEHGFRMGLQIVRPEHSFVDPDLNLSARCDLLVWDHHNNELIGVEIKSVGEYKASKCIESPAKEHVLQSMLYLDFYQRHIPPGQSAPKKWFIWYISRTEGWSIKGRKHGSPLNLMWDYYITLEGLEGTVNVHSANGIERWEHYTIEKLHNRYKELIKALEEDKTPDRDYNLKYDEETIAGLYKLGRLTLKKHKEPIEKWMKKGAIKGELKLEMGDFECRVCPWKSTCWSLPLSNSQIPSNFNLPNKIVPKKEEDPLI